MLRVLLILVPLALAVYALVDCISTKDDEVKHLPKLVWILLIVLATVVGPLAWIFVGRERHRGGGGGGWGRGGSGGGWVAPDDNPEFLKSLGDGPSGPRGATPEREQPGEAEPTGGEAAADDDGADAAGGREQRKREQRKKDDEAEPEEDARHRDDGAGGGGGGPDDPPASR